jgi:hypothetical protein
MKTMYVIEVYVSRGNAGWRDSGFVFDSMLEAELFALGNFRGVKTRVITSREN